MNKITKKDLINLLKNSKIYYINMFDEIEEYKIKKELDEELNLINDNVIELKHLNIWGNAFATEGNVPQVDYNILISEQMEKIGNLLEERKEKTIDIDESYPLEKLAFELSKIGEKEDDYYYYKYSKLKELKDANKQGPEKTLKFIHKYVQK